MSMAVLVAKYSLDLNTTWLIAKEKILASATLYLWLSYKLQESL
jgi:hypothetical protein